MNESFEQMMNRTAAGAGLTTMAQDTPNGATLIWVTAGEILPMRALMSAALGICQRRGLPAPAGVHLRKLEVARPDGRDYYWQLADDVGNVLASDYAATEGEAYAALADAISQKKT